MNLTGKPQQNNLLELLEKNPSDNQIRKKLICRIPIAYRLEETQV